MRTSSFCKKGLLLLVAIVFAGLHSDALAQEIDWRVQLTNIGANLLSKAKVKYEARDDRSKFNVQGEDMDIAMFTSVDVFLNGELLTTVPVNGLGRFAVDWDSRDGDPVPDVQLLDVVDVADSITGAILFTGEIRSETGGGQAQRCGPADTHQDESHLSQGRVSQHPFDIIGSNGRDPTETDAGNSQDNQDLLYHGRIIDKQQGSHSNKSVNT